MINEFEEQVKIEQEKARDRLSKGGGDEAGKETFPDPVKGQARDKAAEKINADVSGRTLEKGQKVKELAEKGNTVAQEKWNAADRSV